jgi:hypothetical protein
VLAITGLLQLRSLGEGRKLDLVLMMTLLIFGTLTSSRTYLVCLLLMACLMILGQPGDFYKKMRLLCILVLLAIMALLLLSWCFPELMEYYKKRFQGGNIGESRIGLMNAYHQYISNNPLVMFLGIGRSDFGTKMTVTYRVARYVPHNAIQEIVVAWGLPGLIMIIMLFRMMIIQSKKYCRKHVLLNYIPLLIIITKCMVGQLLTSTYTILALSYAYLSFCQNFEHRRLLTRTSPRKKSLPGVMPETRKN